MFTDGLNITRYFTHQVSQNFMTGNQLISITDQQFHHTQKKNWEYLVPALAVMSLLVSCLILSSKRYFWNDELYSYYLLSDHSFIHMLSAFQDKINNTPPLYFILGWIWAHVFGATELSLRLFTSLGISIACIVVWMTLRRAYDFWSTSIGTLSVFCTSSIILSQNAEARMYGLFLAVCSFGLLQFEINNRESRSSWWILISNFVINAAIVNTHLFGLFYSGAVLFSQIIADKYSSRFKPKIYLSIVLSWLSLILYIPSFLNQADAGNPRAWLSIPSLEDLINLFTISFPPLKSVLVLLIFVSVLLLISRFRGIRHAQEFKRSVSHFNAEFSLLIFACTFLMVPVVVWVISQATKSIFLDRYMIPSVLSWPILMAYLSSRIIFPTPDSSRNISVNCFRSRIFAFLIRMQGPTLLSALAAILLINPIRYAHSFSKEQLPGLNDEKYGYRQLPIVIEFSHDFVKRYHYSPQKNRYYFILDWQAVVDNESGLFPPQEYKHLDALKRNYYNVFQENIVQSEDFLNRFDRFLVLNYSDYDAKCTLEPRSENFYCPRWLAMRIMSNPHYKVQTIGDIDSSRLLLVEFQK